MLDPALFEPIRQVALAFPGAEDSLSHNATPSIKVRGKLLCRLHESGEFIPIHVGFEHRDYFLETYPETFHLPKHFRKYPYIALWLQHYSPRVLREVLEVGWRGLASQRQLRDWAQQNPPGAASR